MNFFGLVNSPTDIGKSGFAQSMLICVLSSSLTCIKNFILEAASPLFF